MRKTTNSDLDEGAHKSPSSTSRSLRLLEYLSREEQSLTLTELSRRSGTPKSTTLKLLRILQEEGFVIYNRDSKRYILGPAATNLAQLILTSPGLRLLCRPYLQELVHTSREDAYLGIKQDDHIIYIDKVESSQSIRLDIALGTKRPLHSSAVGKLFLAHMQEDVLESWIRERELPIVTMNTLTDPKTLITELERIKKDGISISQGENIEGVTAIAAPIWNDAGEVVAGVSVSGPSSRLNDNLLSLITKLKDTSTSISKDLLWTGIESRNGDSNTQ